MTYYFVEIQKLQMLSSKCVTLNYAMPGEFIKKIEQALQSVREPVVCPNGHHSRDYCGLRKSRPPAITSSNFSTMKSNPPSLFNTYQGPPGCWYVRVSLIHFSDSCVNL